MRVQRRRGRGVHAWDGIVFDARAARPRGRHARDPQRTERRNDGARYSSERGGSMTRVLLVDDHGVVRLGLRTLLSSHADMDVVGEASDGREAISFIETNAVDVVVLDLTMPGMDGQSATKEIARRFPATRVLILTMHD